MTHTEVTVSLVDGMTFTGEDAAGLTITMDAAPEVGGQGHGPKPIAVLAMALGGCTGMDVFAILCKMRQDVTGYAIRVWGERATTHPQVFETLTVEHTLRGNALDPQAVRRAVELSATRYCPASAMLGRAVPLTHRYRVLTAAGEEVAQGEIGEPALS